MMKFRYGDYIESLNALKGRLSGFQPEALLILGSGLGHMAALPEDRLTVPYSQIPHLRSSTAPGHEGRFVFGSLCGKKVAVMQGRVHLYEGYDMEDAAYFVRLLRLCGAEKLIVTNAAGGVNTAFSAGDLMLISDHIKFFDGSPLRGENIPELGVRFPDMTYVYSARLRAVAREAAGRLGIALREGVYVYFPGPQYETPAEIRAARALGGDAVGMSTVPEAIAAAHAGMETLGVSLISNMAAGILDKGLTEEEVMEAGKAASDRFSSLLIEVLKEI